MHGQPASVSLRAPQLSGRELERGDKVRIGLRVAAETTEHLAEREMRTPGVVEREACFEIGLRLAPELLALAQRSQDSQQDRIVIVRLQPALGLFELARRVRDAALAVHLDEIRIPFASEGIGEDVGGLAIAAELNEALRCRARDPGTRPGGVGKTAPVVAQARGILRERLE